MKQIKIWCMVFFTALVFVGCGTKKNDSSVRVCDTWRKRVFGNNQHDITIATGRTCE